MTTLGLSTLLRCGNLTRHTVQEPRYVPPRRSRAQITRRAATNGSSDPEPAARTFFEGPSITSWSAAASLPPTSVARADISTTPQARRKPEVDWTRYHLQVLFIDRTDTTRARIAAGLFEQIAEWNGFGRAMYPSTCGVDANRNQYADLSTTASLMSQAALLGIMPKYFARAADRMDLEDLDRYDIVVVLDNSVRDDILKLVDPQYYSYYDERICLLTDFAPYTGSAVHQTGGLSLMPARMSKLIKGSAEQLEQQVDVDKTVLSDEGLEQWNHMIKVLLLACAGLVKFLIDAYPDDLPHYDPV